MSTKIKTWLNEWVTRSPIELSWTAKKDTKEQKFLPCRNWPTWLLMPRGNMVRKQYVREGKEWRQLAHQLPTIQPRRRRINLMWLSNFLSQSRKYTIWIRSALRIHGSWETGGWWNDVNWTSQLIVLFLVLFPDNFLIKKCLYQLEHHEIDRG